MKRLLAKLRRPDHLGELQTLLFVALGVCALVALVMLLLVRRAARRGDPFAAANVRRLRAVGWVVLLGSLAAFEIELLAGFQLSATVVAEPPSTGADVPLVWCLCGAGFLALAEIIQRGRALQAELAEVI
ncbi:DUF2975 domain-containing protein [Dactylosporangium sp. NPDC049742]|uniref:DUF2975 domain-containing protein n=1 Tax=Dactylosporangium sp. NPDC049742 TaxID=3154737 RepID=UPI0034284755